MRVREKVFEHLFKKIPIEHSRDAIVWGTHTNITYKVILFFVQLRGNAQTDGLSKCIAASLACETLSRRRPGL